MLKPVLVLCIFYVFIEFLYDAGSYFNPMPLTSYIVLSAQRIKDCESIASSGKIEMPILAPILQPLATFDADFV